MSDTLRTAQRSIKMSLEQILSRDFLTFGVGHIAYIKANKEKSVFTLYSADGLEIAKTDSLILAIHYARQQDLEPVILH